MSQTIQLAALLASYISGSGDDAKQAAFMRTLAQLAINAISWAHMWYDSKRLLIQGEVVQQGGAPVSFTIRPVLTDIGPAALFEAKPTRRNRGDANQSRVMLVPQAVLLCSDMMGGLRACSKDTLRINLLASILADLTRCSPSSGKRNDKVDMLRVYPGDTEADVPYVTVFVPSSEHSPAHHRPYVTNAGNIPNLVCGGSRPPAGFIAHRFNLSDSDTVVSVRDALPCAPDTLALVRHVFLREINEANATIKAMKKRESAGSGHYSWRYDRAAMFSLCMKVATYAAILAFIRKGGMPHMRKQTLWHVNQRSRAAFKSVGVSDTGAFEYWLNSHWLYSNVSEMDYCSTVRIDRERNTPRGAKIVHNGLVYAYNYTPPKQERSR